MSKSILILGESGSGKSTSIETLNPKETFIIRVTDKDLPFRQWQKLYTPLIVSTDKTSSTGNIITTHKSSSIVGVLDHIDKYRLDINNIIIDDLQYVMSFEFMERAKEVGFTKFSEIAQNIMNLIQKASKLRENIFVVMLAHSEEVVVDGTKSTKMRTIGKLLEEKISIEGLFTIVFLTEVERKDNKTTYSFITQSNGHNTCKSPKDMFEYKIPNDLQFVKNKMLEYYN